MDLPTTTLAVNLTGAFLCARETARALMDAEAGGVIVNVSWQRRGGRSRAPVYGLATGATAWAASYALLAPAKVYKPMREYPRSVLGKDLSVHLVYGLATGAAFPLLTRRKRR